MAQSSIEWTEATWNPVTGCTRASAGCDFCYAVTMTRRLEAMGQEKYAGLINPGKSHFNGTVRTHPESLEQPLRRKKATIYFVNSMSDLFHPKDPFEFIAAVFGVMAATPQHTYQVLTKRPERATEFFCWLDDEMADPTAICSEMTVKATNGSIEIDSESTPSKWPLTNVWIGTSVEDDRVISRVDALRTVPAHVRFLSCEPLIGALDLHGQLDGIHWVIVGGESGAGARPMRAEWAADIQKACKEAEVAYFFKQTGRVLARESGLGDSKGSKAEAWPEEILKIGGRAFPQAA
ncbi:MAG: phage Gp37/Gp68 family protein [Bacteroidetes bacterium]|nr:phage Gp37/Gp68 family protein [Bacteroidota bacterium]